MNEILTYLYRSLPLIVALIIWAIRLEVRIATIATDITWIKRELDQSPQNSDDHTD